MDNALVLDNMEAHIIGYNKIIVNGDVKYDLSEQDHRPWFVLVYESGRRVLPSREDD